MRIKNARSSFKRVFTIFTTFFLFITHPGDETQFKNERDPGRNSNL